MEDKERAKRYGERVSGSKSIGPNDYLQSITRGAVADRLAVAYLAGLRMGRKLEREAK